MDSESLTQVMDTPNRPLPKTGKSIAKHAVAWFALPLIAFKVNAATPIITAPPGVLQVDVGSTLTFSEGSVATFVGQDTNGFADGTGTAAQFSSDAQGITSDTSGNVYITDSSNHRIRKITPAGVVTTFAGNGIAGDVDGLGTSAQVNTPTDIVMSNSGVLYFADSANNQIRQINLSGEVSKFVGKPAAGDSDGKSAQVKFDNPISVAFDQANNCLFVMDKNNFKIKKIDLNLSTNNNNFCTTLAGDGTQGHVDGTGTSARISYGGISVDSSGNVYLADTANYCIRKITPAGVVTTLAGNPGSQGDMEGIGTSALFQEPVDLTVDEDDFIYVADKGNNKIKRVTGSGVAMDLVGTGTSAVVDGSLFSAQFVAPLSIYSVDEDIYISQSGNGRIREMIRPDHFWVTDIDSATVSVSLSAANGVLTIDLSLGGTITAGSNGSASFTVQGLLDQLNRAFSTLEYDHDMGFTGTDTITYSATDGVNSTGNSTVNILVQTNDAPVISSISNVSLTNHTQDADIDFTVTDGNGDAFSVVYAKYFGDAVVTLTDNGGGNWNILVDPDNGFTGVIKISIIAEDIYNETDQETFFIYVNYTPIAPVLATIGNQTTDEDVTKNLTLSATDGNGDPLTYTAVVNSGNVTANLSGTSLDLVPEPDWFGTANITVTVDDGYGSTDTETFDLTVNPVNDPPTTSSNTVTGNEDEVFVFANFHFPYSDPESDPLNKIRVQAASKGTLWVDTDGNGALDNGETALTSNDEVTSANISKLSYLNVLDENGTAYATFLFEVHDGTDYSNQETMTINITAINDAPVLAAIGNQTTPEDVTKTLTLSATDVEGDTVTLSVVVNSGSVTATLTGTTLDLVPLADWFGTASITVSADDGNGGTDSETFDLVVTPVQDPPLLAAIGDQTTLEDVTKTLSLTATDPDGDSLTFSATVNSGNVTANITGTTLDLIPDPNWFGIANITVTVNDGNGNTDSETFNLTVTSVNDAPILATIGNQSTDEDVNKSLTLSATDVEGDPLIFTAAVNSGNVTATVTGTTLNLVPDADWNGIASITVLVIDGNGGSDSETFNLTINSVNDDPVLTAIGNQTTDEDVTKTLSLSATDVESDPLTFSAVVNSGNVTANVTGTTLNLIPVADWNGTASITVTVDDGLGGTDSETFTLTVNPVNDDPVLAAIGNQTTDEDVTKTLTLSASDVEGDTLTYSVGVNSGNVTATITGTTLDLVPDANWNGVASITVSVDDGNGGTDSETFNLTVNAVNDAPVLDAIGDQTTDEDVTKTLTLSATDVENDPLVFSAVVNSGNVTATVTGTTLDLVPDPDWNGTANITVTVDDGLGGTDSETFDLTVNPINDAPVLAAIGNQTTDEDVTKTLTLSATDVEGDTLTYSVVVNSGNVTASLSGTTLNLIPDANWNGIASITVTVNDGNGGTDSETFNLTVTPVNDVPVLAAIGNQTTPEDVTKTLNLAATDDDGDTLTYSAVVNSGNVAATVVGTTLNLVPNADWNGTASITVTVDDGNGGTDSETFDLVVTPVQDPPVLAAIGDQTTLEDVAKVSHHNGAGCGFGRGCNYSYSQLRQYKCNSHWHSAGISSGFRLEWHSQHHCYCR